jgi:hypothetical protein
LLVPCKKHRTHVSSSFLHFWCSTPRNPPRTDFSIVLLLCSDSMRRTNANPHLHCNFSYKIINCRNHYGRYGTMWLLWPSRVFNNLHPLLELPDPLKDLCVTRSWCDVFGQHSHIDFRWFDTFCIEKSDHKSQMKFCLMVHCKLWSDLITLHKLDVFFMFYL